MKLSNLADILAYEARKRGDVEVDPLMCDKLIKCMNNARSGSVCQCCNGRGFCFESAVDPCNCPRCSGTGLDGRVDSDPLKLGGRDPGPEQTAEPGEPMGLAELAGCVH